MDLMKVNKTAFMTNEALQNLISSWIPELEFTEEGSQFLNISVKPDQLHQLLSKLKPVDTKSGDVVELLNTILNNGKKNWVPLNES
mgnify:CR=1 FL=1